MRVDEEGSITYEPSFLILFSIAYYSSDQQTLL